MAIKAFNTLTRRIEPLELKKEGKIGLYVCGPTVYDYSHIGHARTYIAFDVIVRYLRYKDFDLKYVVNITNVEDKIINRAKESGINPIALAKQFEEAFFDDMDKLGIVKADVYPRVSDNIDVILEMIQTLVQKGFGYEVDGDIYFEVSRFKNYGRLSRQSLDSIKAGARIEVDDRKRSPADFALWKKAKQGEIYWESPWGKGRPGWHIECSAMSSKYLGSQVDIHGGGQDLIFPHHENEIAQSESYSGKEPSVRYWIHSGLLTINGEKMSKSLGNFILIKDLLQKYEADVIRLFIISTHYRRPIDFSEEDLESSKQRLVRIRGTMENLRIRLGAISPSSKNVNDAELMKQIQIAREKFIEAMDNDFNTPRALAAFYKLVQIGNKMLTMDTSGLMLSSILDSMIEMTQIFGIFEKERKKEELSVEAAELLREREVVRSKKDWHKADELRTKLGSMGIIVEDLPEGPRWRYAS